MPQGFYFEESEEDDGVDIPAVMPMNVATRIRTPSIIEISHDGNDDVSTISSSIGKWNIVIATESERGREEVHEIHGGGEEFEGEKASAVSNGDGVGRAESKSKLAD
jgi:hypothetical protein